MSDTSRLRRGDGRYQSLGMTVPAEAAGRKVAVNLGGNTEVWLSSYKLGRELFLQVEKPIGFSIKKTTP